MNFTRSGLTQLIQTHESLKRLTASRVGELQAAESRAQNDLILARELDGLIDFWLDELRAMFEQLNELEKGSIQ